MSKNLLGGAVLATGLLMGCSNNDTIKENNGVLKDSITIIKDSVNKTLIELIDRNTHDCMGGNRTMRKKIPLLETKVIEEKVKGDTVKSNVDDLMRMYEAWIDDGDEMKEYVKQNHEQSDYYSIGAFIIPDIEGKGSCEMNQYDTDKEIEDNIRFAITK